ncbi:MAG TPA: hypothetical protein VI423_05335, partial [Paenisporosarcina sp.]|nr:hypothetical protein [Paenisporosarcina sp.]
FTDGHAAAVYDTSGELGEPDGYLGPYKSGGSFQINLQAFDEIRKTMWFGRLRPMSLPGGGSVE